jgi:hypothetical protein
MPYRNRVERAIDSLTFAVEKAIEGLSREERIEVLTEAVAEIEGFVLAEEEPCDASTGG